MLCADTARSESSVWHGIGRAAFEKRIDALHSTQYVPNSQVLKKKDWPKPREGEILPFKVEKQLPDDIAFVSAYGNGVKYVTAATVEASEQEGLLIRLAANGGVCARVIEAWKRLIPILEGYAKKSRWLSKP